MGATLSAVAKKGTGESNTSSEARKNSSHLLVPPREIYDADAVTRDIILNEDKLHAGSRTPSSASGLTPRSSPRPPSRSPVLPLSTPSSRKTSAVDSMKAKILVKTGEQEKSGTDANVYLQLKDENNLQTIKLKLDQPFYDDLERGNLDSYNLLLPEGKYKCTTFINSGIYV